MAEMDGGPSLSARTTTFQRMLELEKRYKLDRLQTSQLLNAAPATPFLVDNQDRHSLQSRRADSLQTQRQYNDAMVKAVRRSLVPPSLSITIPQRQSDRPRDFDRKQDISAVTEQGSLDQVPVVESLHKQVKFLAPNDEDEDVSDQSSICQSPSWEGYNVKKKEKKLEAERKRRDKEIAVREAKEAKKKLAARLSKTPPSVRRASTALALTITERSSSDPTLPNTCRFIGPGTPALASYAEEQDLVAVSLVNLGTLPRPTNPGPLDVDSIVRPFDREESMRQASQAHRQGETMQSASLTGQPVAGHSSGSQPSEPSPAPRKTVSVGPGLVPSRATVRDVQPASSRLPRDSCPPSASRTPMLASQAQTRPGPSRSNSFLHNAAKIFKGRDSRGRSATSEYRASSPSQGPIHSTQTNERGRQSDSYVRHQRSQSTERAMAMLVDDQLAASAVQHARRPSLTQEAKSVAMRLAGKKQTAKSAPAAGHKKSASSMDLDGFIVVPTSLSGLKLLNPGGKLPSTRYDPIRQDPAKASEKRLQPTASRHSETSLPSPSATSSSANELPETSAASLAPPQKAPAFKDVSKAALARGKGTFSELPQSLPKSPVSLPNFLLRAKLTSPSSSAAPPKNDAPVSARGNEYDLKHSSSHSVRNASTRLGVGSRVSEGSTSSSTYDDGSPPASPVTTPDTSRPQSSGGVPMHLAQGGKENSGFLITQNDERTPCVPAEVVQEPSGQCTPSTDKTERGEGQQRADEDGWSRTALPLDVDFDAQSFVTSFSHLDQSDAVNVEMPHLVQSSSADHASLARKSREEHRQDAMETLESSWSPKRQEPADDTARGAESSDRLQAGMEKVSRESSPGDLNRRVADTPDSGSETFKRAKLRMKPGRSQEQNSTEQTLAQSNLTRGVSDSGLDTSPTLNRGTTDISKISSDSGLLSCPSMLRSPLVGLIPPPGAASKAFFVDFDAQATNAALAESEIRHEQLGTLQHPAIPPSAKTSTASFAARMDDARGRCQAPNPFPTYSTRAFSSPSVVTAGATSVPIPKAAVTRAPASTTAVPRVAAPVSILKQRAPRSPSPPELSAAASASRVPVLSALPKHMQLQAGMAARPAALTEAHCGVGAPMTKVLVECCSCRFYHDMPSKVYECMLNPDAVVQDHSLGISGAITTRVRCPWCQHEMSTQCCAGYAAVVYLEQKLH